MRCALLALLALPLAACGVFENDAARAVDQNIWWTTPAAFTTPDVRVITQREHPVTHRQIVCAEPGADVAKAISTAFQGQGSGGNGAENVSVGLGGSSAEAVAELAGRSTALLGLRDGLYRACEAYGNGVIGDDAYALIMSRYGQLMTTLFLGQDAAGSVGVHTAAETSPPAAVSLPGAAPPGGATGGGKGGGTPAATSPQLSAPTATGAGGSGAAPNGVPSVAIATSANPGSVFRDMNKDYLDLDQYELHLLIVACVNENDHTRVDSWTNGGQTNGFLKPLCDYFAADPQKLIAAITAAAVAARAAPPAPTAVVNVTTPPSPAAPQARSARQPVSRSRPSAAAPATPGDAARSMGGSAGAQTGSSH
ncbi:MAG: hypothetical protein JO038_07765 [Alphaproteobacteria bacterium]|nr:hypothetical protein [Alphaproteobacteria bacterium]